MRKWSKNQSGVKYKIVSGLFRREKINIYQKSIQTKRKKDQGYAKEKILILKRRI